jgi:cytochrome P450
VIIGILVAAMRNTPYVIDYRDPNVWRDPYPFLREAQSRGRTAVTHEGEPIVLRADDAEMIHTDPRFITPGLWSLERIGICDGPFYDWRARTLNVLNGPAHAHLRSFVGPAFAPRQMERLRLIATERANFLIDAIMSRQEIDVVEDYASDLPLTTMCRFIGIDDEDRRAIADFLVGTEASITENMTLELRKSVENSITALNAYVADLISRRRRSPKDDMVSALVVGQSAQDGPTYEDFHALLVNILGGSVGSTRAALSNGLLVFAENPDQAELLRNNPALARRAGEECLRYHPPFRLGRRVATEPVSVLGLELKQGDSLLFARQAINRDPSRFEDPDRFNIARPEYRHSSFAYGPHFCLGQAVARINVQAGISVFLSRCTELAIVSKPERVPFVPDEQLKNLRISFRPIN